MRLAAASRTVFDDSTKLRCAASFTKVACLLSGVMLALTLAARAQTPDTAPPDSNSTSTTESQDSSAGARNRTVESHTQSGNRTVDKQTIQILRSGAYEPYQDVERETIQVDRSTARTTVRTYARDANGQRTLVQVTEEEKQQLPGGGSKLVRSVSNPDANGRLAVVQRQVEDTTKVSKDVEETKTTTYLPSVNGGMAPSMQVQERREHVDDHTVRSQKSTLLPDGAGNWQTAEVKKSTTTDAGPNRTTEENVLRQDDEGRLGEVSRTVTRESQAAGESGSVVEHYSKELPGSSADGSLHLVQRVTTARHESADGHQATEQQQVEQVNPGDPSAGLHVTVGTTSSKQQDASGTRETRSLDVRGSDGRLGIVSVDMTKSDQVPVQVQIAPAQKPK